MNGAGLSTALAFGIMLALLHRHRAGEGQDVNSSLSRTATMHQVPFMVGFAGRVWDEPSGPKARGWHLFNRLYRASDGWFFFSTIRHDGRRLLEACSIFEGVILPTGYDNLERWLEARFAALPSQTSVTALNEVGFGAQRHFTLAELATDSYAARHGFIAAVDHPGIGRALGIGLLVYAASQRSATVLAARRPGMDTLDLLKEHGFESRIGEFLRDKVVAIGEASILNTPQTIGYWGKVDLDKPSITGGLAPTREIVEMLNGSTPFAAEPTAGDLNQSA